MDLQQYRFSQMAEETMCSESKLGLARTFFICFAISCAMGKDEKKTKRISAKSHDGGKSRMTSKKNGTKIWFREFNIDPVMR